MRFLNRASVFFWAWLALAWTVCAQQINPALPIIPPGNFNVLDYGAVADGQTDNTAAITAAIDDAINNGGGTVEIPPGTNSYLADSVYLDSGIRFQVDSGAKLQMQSYENYSGSSVFIFCYDVHDLEICGGGVIDGQGGTWWGTYPGTPPMLLDLYSVDRLFIHDITFENSPYHTCGIRENSGNVTISNLTEIAPPLSPNTDGLDFVGTNSVIENCNISVGDDNIALGSTGQLTNLLITNCVFGSGHGISIGSSVSDGITNLTVVNCSFTGTVNGIRIKVVTNDAVVLANLNYLNLTMTNVEYPIVIYTYYNLNETPNNITPAAVLTYPATATGNPAISGITISNLNITAGSSSRTPQEIIWGPTDWPISNVALDCITNNSASTFELYNVSGVRVTDSQFNFAGTSTFSVCNAGLIVSNTTPGRPNETITGAVSGNSLALYNATMSANSTNFVGATPITLSGSTLTANTALTLPATTVQNFLLGSNPSAIAVAGNLTSGSTVNISNGAGFGGSNYTLFTYTGSLNGAPVLGTTPTGFQGYSYKLDTGSSGKIMLDVTAPSPPDFSARIEPGEGSSANLVCSGTGGVTNGTYSVLTSTNAALPLNQWTLVATNNFNGVGGFSFSNTVDTNAPMRFFRLQIPEP